MADLGQTFDPNSAPPRDTEFDTIAAGKYSMQIEESDLVDTKAGNGKIVKLTWTIIDGPLSGRKVFHNINIVNKSPKAQEIGHRELADICDATGAGPVRDTTQLHYKPCLVTIGIKKDEGYDDRNVVKRVKSLTGAVPATQQRQPGAASAAPARPWGRPQAPGS